MYCIHLVIPQGSKFERQVGSVTFGWLNGIFCVLSNVLVACAASTEHLIGFDMAYVQCAVGYSTAIFTLLTIDSLSESSFMQRRQATLTAYTHAHAHTRMLIANSFFGIPVPVRAYPWVLLVFIQLLIPFASFHGHLAGIAVGYLCMLYCAIALS